MSFIDFETSGMSETTLMSWDGDIVLQSVSVIYLLTHVDTWFYCNKYLCL